MTKSEQTGYEQKCCVQHLGHLLRGWNFSKVASFLLPAGWKNVTSEVLCEGGIAILPNPGPLTSELCERGMNFFLFEVIAVCLFYVSVCVCLFCYGSLTCTLTIIISFSNLIWIGEGWKLPHGARIKKKSEQNGPMLWWHYSFNIYVQGQRPVADPLYVPWVTTISLVVSQIPLLSYFPNLLWIYTFVIAFINTYSLFQSYLGSLTRLFERWSFYLYCAVQHSI